MIRARRSLPSLGLRPSTGGRPGIQARLTRWAQIARRRWLWALAGGTLAAIPAFFLAWSAPRYFEARALIVFAPSIVLNQDSSSADAARIAAEISGFRRADLALRISSRLKLNGSEAGPSASEILSRLSARRRDNTYVIELRARGPSPQDAAALANIAAQEHFEARLERPFEEARLAGAALNDLRDAAAQAAEAVLMAQTPSERAVAEQRALAARAAYETQLLRIEQMSGAMLATPQELRLVEPASAAAARSSFTMTRGLALALAAGLVGAVLAVAVAHALNDTLESPEDVAWRARARLLCAIPQATKRELRTLAPDRRTPLSLVMEKPQSDFAESMRLLRATLVGGARRRLSVFSVAAPGGPDDAGLVALGLGRSAAAGGETALYVSCGRDSEHLETVGVPYADETGWRRALELDAEGDLHVLRLPALARDAGKTNAAVLAEILKDARGRYRFVVLDCGAALHDVATHALARRADMTLIVAKAGVTPARAVRVLRAQLLRAGCRVAGVALDRVKPSGRRAALIETQAPQLAPA